MKAFEITTAIILVATMGIFASEKNYSYEKEEAGQSQEIVTSGLVAGVTVEEIDKEEPFNVRSKVMHKYAPVQSAPAQGTKIIPAQPLPIAENPTQLHPQENNPSSILPIGVSVETPLIDLELP